MPNGSLWLCSTESGPYAPQCDWLLTGTPVNVCLSMPAPDGASSISARIRMSSPGGPAQTLATATWTRINAFDQLYLEASVIPQAWGTYVFKAELTDMTPVDSVPGGTSQYVSCTTREPPKIASRSWVQSLDFGYQDEESIPTGVVVGVYNAGGATLQMGQLSLGGPHAAAYSMEDNMLSGASLQPGQTGTVRVVFEPTVAGRNQAYLSLPCNDPYRSGYAISISSDYLIPEPLDVLWLLPVWYAIRHRRR
jgi:hypothetical protein